MARHSTNPLSQHISTDYTTASYPRMGDHMSQIGHEEKGMNRQEAGDLGNTWKSEEGHRARPRSNHITLSDQECRIKRAPREAGSALACLSMGMTEDNAPKDGHALDCTWKIRNKGKGDRADHSAGVKRRIQVASQARRLKSLRNGGSGQEEDRESGKGIQWLQRIRAAAGRREAAQGRSGCEFAFQQNSRQATDMWSIMAPGRPQDVRHRCITTKSRPITRGDCVNGLPGRPEVETCSRNKRRETHDVKNGSLFLQGRE
jgi:hypothetical protein